MGMLFMKGSKTPPTPQLPQTASQDEEKNDNPDGNHSGTATTKLAKMPSVYKQNATTIFKPLSSNEMAKMLKEVEAGKT